MFYYVKTDQWVPFRYNVPVISQSLYDKADITYPIQKTIYQTKKETKVDKVIDADGKEVILRTYEVETPILDEKWNPIIKEKVREIVRYNPYDDWYTIISDDSVVISEEEFHNAILNLNRETNKEKDIDRKEANDILLSWRFLVNINWKGKKKVATVHDSKTTPEWTLIEYDEERGDINTDNIDIANKYADIVNNESIEKAIEWYKTL